MQRYSSLCTCWRTPFSSTAASSTFELLVKSDRLSECDSRMVRWFEHIFRLLHLEHRLIVRESIEMAISSFLRVYLITRRISATFWFSFSRPVQSEFREFRLSWSKCPANNTQHDVDHSRIVRFRCKGAFLDSSTLHIPRMGQRMGVRSTTPRRAFHDRWWR